MGIWMGISPFWFKSDKGYFETAFLVLSHVSIVASGGVLVGLQERDARAK